MSNRARAPRSIGPRKGLEVRPAAGFLYLEFRCFGCDTHQTAALDALLDSLIRVFSIGAGASWRGIDGKVTGEVRFWGAQRTQAGHHGMSEKCQQPKSRKPNKPKFMQQEWRRSAPLLRKPRFAEALSEPFIVGEPSRIICHR
jgi:hypothetical protein